jgi:hypothetical protein
LGLGSVLKARGVEPVFANEGQEIDHMMPSFAFITTLAR